MENNHRPGDTAGSVMNRGGGIFNSVFASIAAYEDAIHGKSDDFILLDGHLHGISNGFTCSSINNSENFRLRSASRFLPQPPRHFFCDDIEKGDVARDVCADNSIADAVQSDLRAFLFYEQRLFCNSASRAVALYALTCGSGNQEAEQGSQNQNSFSLA